MMKQITKVVPFLFLGILNITAYSCSKSIYVHVDEYGSSSFTIYKRNYKYTEKTAYTDFETWGTHYISNDSTLTFVYKKPRQLPYKYLATNVRKAPKSGPSNFTKIEIVDKKNQNEVPFLEVILKDSSNQIVAAIGEKFYQDNGITTNKKFTSIEISAFLHATQVIRGNNLDQYDFFVELEKIEQGGRLVGSCLPSYIDVLLQFKIDSTAHFQSFEKDGVVYKKQRKN